MTHYAEERHAMISHQTRCAADSIPSFSSAVASGETSSNAGDRTLTGTAPGQNLGGFEMKTNNNDMDFVSEEQLTQIFADIGKDYGYTQVDAEFVVFRDFKVRWQRSYKWASFKVSDYMMDAPAQVIEDLARTLFSKISNKQDAPYTDNMVEWMTSKDFVRHKQPVYLRRSSGLTRSSVGEVRNLNDSMARLIYAGLAEADPDLVLTWMKEKNIRKVGSCSVLMKVIAISSIFDSMDIPEFVLDYVVYHEYLHASKGLKVFGRPHDSDFKEGEAKFPKHGEAEEWLSRLCLYA